MLKLLIFVFFLGIIASCLADPASEQLLEYKASIVNQSTLLTSFGTPVDSLRATLTAGPNGPILLQDTIFIDHMAHFDRERIPERVVHANGRGAFGIFNVTHDITQYTKASVFQLGEVTEVIVRFSNSAGRKGSPETVRTGRGFAIKFYTKEGIYDLVANNSPIAIVRNAMLFPSLTHALKNPVTNCPDPNAFWDIMTSFPETTYEAMILFSDGGIPETDRHMHGYAVHAFKLVNQDGKAVYCKFHLLTDQGIQNLSPEKAREIAGTDTDYVTRDLYNAIHEGNFPSWTFYIQVMTFEEAETFRWNPFDATKMWPESEFPLIPVGKLVLNRNPTNYFAEIEQLAFCPSSMPPGIEPTPDNMLQARLFAYKDTQRYRLGPNFMQIPVNCPLSSVTNYQRDGPQAIYNQGSAPSYFPNSFSGPKEEPNAKIKPYPVSGDVDRYDTRNDDNFSQATMYWNNTLSEEERVRLVNNLVGALSRTAVFIQERAVTNFCQVDKRMGEMIATGLSINAAC